MKTMVLTMAGMVLAMPGWAMGEQPVPVEAESAPAARSANVERLVQLLEEYAQLIEQYAPLYKKIQAGDFSQSQDWAAFGEKMVAWSEKWSEEYLNLFMELSPAEMEQVSRDYAALQKRLEAIMNGS